MKKLNRKGFTLVELLAVIVILAIVVGIAIPSVTSIINGSKNSALGVAVENAADYLKDQYDIYNVDASAIGPVIAEVMATGATGKTYTNADTTKLEALGFDPKNVTSVFVKVVDNPANATAQICVRVTGIPKTSDYFVTSYWTLGTGANADKATPTTGVTGLQNSAGNGC